MAIITQLVTLDQLTGTTLPSISAESVNTGDRGFTAGMNAFESRRAIPFGTDIDGTFGAAISGSEVFVISNNNMQIASAALGNDWVKGPIQPDSLYPLSPHTGLWFIGPSGTAFAMENESRTVAEYNLRTGAVIRPQMYFKWATYYSPVSYDAAVVSGTDIYTAWTAFNPYVAPRRVVSVNHNNLFNIDASTIPSEPFVGLSDVGELVVTTAGVLHNSSVFFFGWDTVSGTSYCSLVQEGIDPSVRYSLGNQYISDVVSYGSHMYAVGFVPSTSASYFLSSTDGNQWGSSSISDNFIASHVIRHSGSWYAFSYDGTAPVVASSTVGNVWTSSSINDPELVPVSVYALNGDLYVIGLNSQLQVLHTGTWNKLWSKAGLSLHSDDGVHVTGALYVGQNSFFNSNVEVTGNINIPGNAGALLISSPSNVTGYTSQETHVSQYEIKITSDGQAQLDLATSPYGGSEVSLDAYEDNGPDNSLLDVGGRGRFRMRVNSALSQSYASDGLEITVYGLNNNENTNTIQEVNHLPSSITYISGATITGTVQFVSGVVVQSPNGSKWVIGVSNSGTFTATAV